MHPHRNACGPQAVDRRHWLSRMTLGALSAGLGWPWAHAAELQAQQVVVPMDVLRDYQRFLRGRLPLEVQDFSGPHARRDVIEVFILQHALAVGGWKNALAFTGMPTSARLHREVDLGHAVCGGTSYWSEDFTTLGTRVRLSDPVIGLGDFEAGFYTLPSHRKALACQSADDLRKLRALSCQTWVVDWRTLTQLNPAELIHSAIWDQMPKMLQAGRADFILAPFQPTPDLAMVVDGIQLVPIPGLKIGLQGTRHFVTSARHPQGEALHLQLNAGLQQLHAKGWIRKAYTQCGFFNERTAKWRRVDKDMG